MVHTPQPSEYSNVPVVRHLHAAWDVVAGSAELYSISCQLHLFPFDLQLEHRLQLSQALADERVQKGLDALQPAVNIVAMGAIFGVGYVLGSQS